MKAQVVDEEGGTIDLRGRSYVLITREGDDAEVRFSGPTLEVGQLLDAGLRAAIHETREAKPIC